MDLTEVQKGYIAGIIDGEGSIGIKKSDGNGYAMTQFQPRIIVRKKNMELMNFFKDIFGGYIHTDGKNKDCFKWEMVKSNVIKEMLEQIQPYLIVKKEQAKILIDFIPKMVKRIGKKDFSDITNMYINYHERIKQLNFKSKGIKINFEKIRPPVK